MNSVCLLVEATKEFNSSRAQTETGSCMLNLKCLEDFGGQSNVAQQCISLTDDHDIRQIDADIPATCSPRFSVKDPVITSGVTDAKFLEVLRNQQTDRLSTSTSKALKELKSGTPTKRKLLRGVASIFDCCGILAPICMNAKILFQKLWKDKIGWDDPLK